MLLVSCGGGEESTESDTTDSADTSESSDTTEEEMADEEETAVEDVSAEADVADIEQIRIASRHAQHYHRSSLGAKQFMIRCCDCKKQQVAQM